MDLGDRIQKHVYILFKWDKGFKIVRNLEPFSRFPQNPYHMECFFYLVIHYLIAHKMV